MVKRRKNNTKKKRHGKGFKQYGTKARKINASTAYEMCTEQLSQFGWLLPLIKFLEMADNRENCLCCGGGGNLEMIDTALSAEIARAKIDQVLAIGAQAVVTACQQCVRAMSTYVRRNKIKLEVLDVVQLIQRAIES